MELSLDVGTTLFEIGGIMQRIGLDGFDGG